MSLVVFTLFWSKYERPPIKKSKYEGPNSRYYFIKTLFNYHLTFRNSLQKVEGSDFRKGLCNVEKKSKLQVTFSRPILNSNFYEASQRNDIERQKIKLQSISRTTRGDILDLLTHCIIMQ